MCGWKIFRAWESCVCQISGCMRPLGSVVRCWWVLVSVRIWVISERVFQVYHAKFISRVPGARVPLGPGMVYLDVVVRDCKTVQGITYMMQYEYGSRYMKVLPSTRSRTSLDKALVGTVPRQST